MKKYIDSFMNYRFLLSELVKKGIKLCLEIYSQIESLAIDTWGCDYVLMN